MPTAPFDPALYTRAPVLTIGSAITLGRTLVELCPKSSPTNVKKAAKKLKAAVDDAQAAWAERQREVTALSDEDSRVVDQLMDNLWSALRSRLTAYAALPADEFPRSPRAGELVALLFGADGLAFLRDPYPVQLSTMDTLLKRVDADDLGKEIDDLAGPEFLKAIRKTLPRYKAMVQAILRRDDATGQNLLEHVRAIQRTVVDYATKVCATVDEDDPETIEAAREALRPIANLRDQAAVRRGAPAPPSPGEASDTPV